MNLSCPHVFGGVITDEEIDVRVQVGVARPAITVLLNVFKFFLISLF